MTRDRRPGDRREHRTVVLPDFQGIGIGNRVSELCDSIWKGVGGRAYSTTSHPGMLRYRDASPHWRTVRFGMVAPTGATGLLHAARKDPAGMASMRLQRMQECRQRSESLGRITGGFEYIGEPMEESLARGLIQSQPKLFAVDGAAEVLSCCDEFALLSSRAIARRAGLPAKNVASLLAKLEATNEVKRIRIGNRLGYCRDD